MKKTKIIAMMMTGALLMPMANVGKTTYAKEVAKTAITTNVESNREFVSVKSNAKLVDANGKELSKVTTGDMAVKLGTKDGKTLVRLVKTGAEGYLEEASIMNINDGDVNKIETKDTHGAIKNVDTLVNVRELPSIKSEIKDVLVNNTGVKILGKTGDWYQVNVGGVKGYIFSNYVEEGATGRVVTTPSKTTVEHKDVVSKPNKGGNVTRPTITKAPTSSHAVVHKATAPKAEVKHEEVKQQTPAQKTEVVKPVENTQQATQHKTEVVKPVQKEDSKTEVVKPVENTPAQKTEVVKPSQSTEVKHDAVKPVQNTEVKPSETTEHKTEVKPSETTEHKTEVKPSSQTEVANHDSEKPVQKTDVVKPVEAVKHEYNVPVITPDAGECLMDRHLTKKLDRKYGRGFYGNYKGEAVPTMGGVYTRLMSDQMSLDQAKKELVGKYVEDGYQIKDIKMINMDIPQDEWAIYMDGSDYIEKHGGMQEFKADKQADFFTMWNHNGDDQRHFTRVVFLMDK